MVEECCDMAPPLPPQQQGGVNDGAVYGGEDSSSSTITLSYVEFYSGIGGWGLALEEACRRASPSASASGRDNGVVAAAGSDSAKMIIRARRLAAFDNSDVANHVLRYNVEANAAGGLGGGVSAVAANRASDTTPPSDKKKRRRRNDRKKDGVQCRSIERLKPGDLRKLGHADVWLLSPPCQPHTRQNEEGSRKDADDPRSKSFLFLCSLFHRRNVDEGGDSFPSDETGTIRCEDLPGLILLENVVGFESSTSCDVWRRALLSRGYRIAHFHLNPTQVGMPNDRMRHYTVAVLWSTEVVEGQRRCRSWDVREALMSNGVESPVADRFLSGLAWEAGSSIPCPPADAALPPIEIMTSIDLLGVKMMEDVELSSLPPISTFLDMDVPPLAATHNGKRALTSEEKLRSLRIPPKLLSRDASWCLDVITPSDHRSSCFTRSYGRFLRGTGSVLYLGGGERTTAATGGCRDAGTTTDPFALVDPSERTFSADWGRGLDLEKNLRYLSGTEVARLMGFPVVADDEGPTTTREVDGGRTKHRPPAFSSFGFPPDCTVGNRWKLLGNSLHVTVAARVAEVGVLCLIARAQAQPQSPDVDGGEDCNGGRGDEGD